MSAESAKNDLLDLTLAPDERPAAPVGQAARSLRRPWSRLRFRVGGSLGEATTATAMPAMPDDGADAPPLRPQKYRKSWREQRWERRRRRRLFEEVLGWILVPIILLAVYWGIKAGLNAMGTTPTALIQGIKGAISSRGGGGL
jgi:hypothetical protein